MVGASVLSRVLPPACANKGLTSPISSKIASTYVASLKFLFLPLSHAPSFPFPLQCLPLGAHGRSHPLGTDDSPNPAYVGSPLLLAGVASRQPGNFGEARSSADDVGGRGRGRLLSTREVISFAVPLIIICEVNKQQRMRLVEAWAWLSLSWLR